MKALKLCLLFVLSGLLGCSLGQEPAGQPLLLKDVMTEIQPPAVVELAVQRKRLVEAMNQGKKFDSLRIVPVYTRSSELEGRAPAYRLFDVRPGSAYQILGLQEGDELLAANGYLIYDPAKFRRYVWLLQREKSAVIDIKREGRRVQLKVALTD